MEESTECLWYNGTEGMYELLDFDTDGLTGRQIIDEAKRRLEKKYGFGTPEWTKVLRTLYVLQVKHLKEVKE